MTEAQKAFIRILRDIDRSKRALEVFGDFCELAYCAIAKPAQPTADRRDALEEQYMSVVARYRDKDAVRRMPELLTIALPEIAAGGCDFLGEIAAEIGALDATQGQFFTPYTVSRFVAELNLTDAPALIDSQGFITVSEPAAGAGGMLMALADVIEAKGNDLSRQVWIEAVELSARTFYMCFIQCAARGIAGKIIHGNSLSMEIFTSVYTPAAHVFLAANGDPFAREKERAAAREAERAEAKARADRECDKRHAEITAQPPRPGEQLSFF